MGPVATFKYKNHRGEIAERTITVGSIEYLPTPGYGYKPGWFVSGWCHTKRERRSFSFANIQLDDAPRQPGGILQLIRF